MFKKNTISLFVASSFFIIACMVYVYVFLISSRDEVRAFTKWAEHSKTVIFQVQQTLATEESMLSEQRGYFITGDDGFAQHFDSKRKELQALTLSLVSLTADNPQQNERAKEISNFAQQYMEYLNLRKEKFKDMSKGYDPEKMKEFRDGLKTVEILHDRLTTIISELMKVETSLLQERVKIANDKREEYGRNLIISLFGACGLIMLMNWVLFHTQKKFYLDSDRLRHIDDRHKIALRAANDGVFDWNIAEKEIFLSAQIFKMCGYDKEDYEGSLAGVILFMSGQNPLNLIHPDDIAEFKQNLQYFVDGVTSEYNNVFRVKHPNGYWMWVHACGGGIFNQEGKPVRLIGTHSDITVQKQMEERLKKEREEADSSSKLKMEFLAHMSHEIRTPLTTVTGVAEIMERQAAKYDQKEKSLIKTLVTSATTLKDLINDVLDFSRIDSGEIRLEKNAIQLQSLMDDVMAIMSVQAIEKGIEFGAEYTDVGALVFEGDHVRLRQIIINLVGNAIKFTVSGSVKIIAALQSSNEDMSAGILSIKVIDTGIGIAEEYFEIIFDKFRQVDDTISKRFGGTGLGLPISRSLAEMMSGRLTVSSEVGKGSVFTLEIPIVILNSEEFMGRTDMPGAVLPFGSKVMGRSCDAGSKVLMVEDYEGNIVVISYLLDEMGLSYDVARNGIEAIEKFRDGGYQAILMDLQMPKMDGLTATLQIREIERLANISPTPIIGMTAHATYKDKQGCIEAGMTDFISKPIDQPKLVAALLQYVKKS